MKIMLIVSIMTAFLAGSEGINNFPVKNDQSLILPGAGAESIVLKQSADDIIFKKGYPDKIVELQNKKELFEEIFKIKTSIKIIFDKIFYYNSKKAIFFLNSNSVCAIAGLSNQRVTSDSVDLSRGVEYFIFNYGNNNMEILKKEDESSDIIYCYMQGIAIVDDKGDDRIDMYIVFPGYF